MSLSVLDWNQFRIVAGDSAKFVTNFNNYLSALENLVSEQNTLSQNIDQDRLAVEQAKNDAVAARDEAQAIAVGDIVDDTQSSTNLVWSSEKTKQELDSIIANDWKVVTEDYAAQPGDRLLVVTTTGAINITMWASPSVGKGCEIKRSGENPVNLLRNGELMKGKSEDGVLARDGDFTAPVFLGGSIGWDEV